MQKKHHKGGHIGGQVNDLALGIGALDAEMRKHREGNDQEGAGARTIEAVIEAHDQRRKNRRHKGPPIQMDGLILNHAEELFVQDNEGGHRQHHHEHSDQKLLRCNERKAGAHAGAQHCRRHRRHRQLPVHQLLTNEAPGGHTGAAHGRHLVGGDGLMGRQPHQKIGRQGNQTAPAADGIHQPRQKNK